MRKGVQAMLELRRRMNRWSVRTWDNELPGLIAEYRERDDLTDIYEEASEKTQLDARIRVLCRRAYRAKTGLRIENHELTKNKNFGRF